MPSLALTWAISLLRGLSVPDPIFQVSKIYIKKNSHNCRIVRFLAVGCLNTVFGFAVYSMAILMGVTVSFALLLGMLAGTGFNFITTGGYVFRSLSLSRFPIFFICYVFIYLVNLGLLEFLSIWLSNKLLSQALVTLPMAVLAYLLMAKFVFAYRRD